jgi:hypothetical protein
VGGFPVTEFDRGIFDLPRLFRLLCVCLGVTVMVAVQMHGVQNNQHSVQHSVQFPGVTYEAMAEVAHHHDHVPASEAPDGGAVLDVADNGDAPFSHHHHSGGDIHLALTAPVHPVGSGLLASLDLGPAPDALPPGLTGDDPSHPPKHARLIA